MEKVFKVDSFTNQPFRGNPAGVVLQQISHTEEWMQDIAAEMALPETAFVLPLEKENEFYIQWFTPTTQAELCGHATLAAAHVMWETGIVDRDSIIRFMSRSGPVSAKWNDNWIELNFPTESAEHIADIPSIIAEEFGYDFKFIGKNRMDYCVVLADADAVINYQPNFFNLAKLGRGIIITAASKVPGYDFVSRVFAPSEGIPEDPVTGSAHCWLSHYWSAQLQKTELIGYQASKRGGIVRVKYCGERTLLFGQAICVMQGQLINV